MGFLMQELGRSEGRSCRVVGLSRSVQRYRPVPRNDAAEVARLKELASENRRYGDLRRHAVLRREGLVVNQADLAALHRAGLAGPHQEAAQAAAP